MLAEFNDCYRPFVGRVGSGAVYTNRVTVSAKKGIVWHEIFPLGLRWVVVE
jgi:hypothetical protein